MGQNSQVGRIPRFALHSKLLQWWEYQTWKRGHILPPGGGRIIVSARDLGLWTHRLEGEGVFRRLDALKVLKHYFSK